MSQPEIRRHASPEAVAGALDLIVQMVTDPPVSLPAFTREAEQHGWSTPEDPRLFETNLPTLTGRLVIIASDDEIAFADMMFVPADEASVRDFFAEVTAFLSEHWGPPVSKRRGQQPQVRWDLSTAVVTVQNSGDRLRTTVLTPFAYTAMHANGSI